MNISSLARQLKVTTPELLERLPELGFDIGAKAIKVDDSLVPKIITAWKKDIKKTKLKEELSKVKEVSDNYLFSKLKNVIGVVSDKQINTILPQFKRTEINKIAEFILRSVK